MRHDTYFVVAFAIACDWAHATNTVRVQDDLSHPVQGTVLRDGVAVDNTDVSGTLHLSPACESGVISAQPISDPAEYVLPSPTEYCLPSVSEVTITLTRKRVEENIHTWYTAAVGKNWAVAAQAANEYYSLLRRTDPQKAEQAKLQALTATAHALDLDPKDVIRFDSAQGTHVITAPFADAIIRAKAADGQKHPSAAIDSAFLSSMSKVSVGDLRYEKVNREKLESDRFGAPAHAP